MGKVSRKLSDDFRMSAFGWQCADLRFLPELIIDGPSIVNDSVPFSFDITGVDHATQLTLPGFRTTLRFDSNGLAALIPFTVKYGDWFEGSVTVNTSLVGDVGDLVSLAAFSTDDERVRGSHVFRIGNEPSSFIGSDRGFTFTDQFGREWSRFEIPTFSASVDGSVFLEVYKPYHAVPHWAVLFNGHIDGGDTMPSRGIFMASEPEARKEQWSNAFKFSWISDDEQYSIKRSHGLTAWDLWDHDWATGEN